MRKFLLKLHLWLAFPLGLIVTVICLSGALLVFRTEIEGALHPDRYFVPADGTRLHLVPHIPGEVQPRPNTATPLSLAQLGVLVEAQLGEPVTGFSVPSDPARNYMATPASNPRASAYVDPYTGEVVARTGGGSFFGTMLKLHRWLLHPAVGKPVVGYTTLLFVVILVTGIVITVPKHRKQWKRVLTVHTRKGWRRFWRDLHVGAGMWVAVVLLALALTGLTWSFRWYNTAFYRALGADPPPARAGAPGSAVGTR
ncbi:MAG: PepSY domain-containing protein, partial [Prevotellaceae bacterium]|nr:PepSY domain-containing protein [Prevotellaceae bacterium]